MTYRSSVVTICSILKYASCSNECFVLALVYIDRLIQRNNFLLTDLNVHRVVITAVLLSAKFFDDAYYNNAYYAKVGGVLVSEMNGLEVDFLFRINFSLHVTPELFHKYRAELASHSAAAGVTLPALSPSMHHTRSSYHGDIAVAGGHVSRRSESLFPRAMQYVTEEKHVSANGAFITPSPPSTSAQASAFPCGLSSNGSKSSVDPCYPYPEPTGVNGHGYTVVIGRSTVHMSSHSIPVPASVGTSHSSNSMDTDEQFVSAANELMPHYTSVPETGSLGRLMQQHYQASSAPVSHGFHHHRAPSGSGYVTSDSSGSVQHFIGGENMLTGVSGGHADPSYESIHF